MAATAAAAAAAAATVRISIRCEAQVQPRTSEPGSARRSLPTTPRTRSAEPVSDKAKILLQPRLCTLRSYGPGGNERVPARKDAAMSPFLASLSDYIENSRKSQDMEILFGRLAMIAFAGALTVEATTGNSIFGKMKVEGIVEAAGACLGAVVFAAAVAWVSSNKTRVGRIFTVKCNDFVDSLVDGLFDGMFSETELNDWTNDI